MNFIGNNEDEINAYYQGKWSSFLNESNISYKTTRRYKRIYNLPELGDDFFDKYTKKVDLKDAFNDPDVKVYTSGRYKITNGGNIDYFSVRTLARNYNALNRYLYSINISKDDNVVIFCVGGYESRDISFILNFYGYNTKYAKLFDYDGNSVIDESNFNYFFNTDELNTDIVIDEITFVNPQNYLMVYLDEDNLFGLNNRFLVNNIKNNITVLTYQELYYSNVNYSSKTVFFDEVSVRDILNRPDQEIICHRTLHCFLTRQLLEHYNVSSVKTIFKISPTSDLEEVFMDDIPKLWDNYYVVWINQDHSI